MRACFIFITLILLSIETYSHEPSDAFTVTTIKTTKPAAPRDIELIHPPHKCTMSAGVVTFEWLLKRKFKKKKIELIIEDTAKNKRLVLSAKETKRKHYVEAGIYRWRVVEAKSKLDSRWRVFKVVNLDGTRGLSSVKKKKLKGTRESQFIKYSPELADFGSEDFDDSNLPMTIDHLPIPTEVNFKN